MYVYKIEFLVKVKQRSILIEVFSRLRDRTWISTKRDRAVLKAIANDNLELEIREIIRLEAIKDV